MSAAELRLMLEMEPLNPAPFDTKVLPVPERDHEGNRCAVEKMPANPLNR